VFGNRVDIGAGAVILGPIHIGDNVSIGANAVVLKDIPPNSIAVGVPAVVRPKKAVQEAVNWHVIPEAGPVIPLY
jgi:serine O-acetyltransferase